MDEGPNPGENEEPGGATGPFFAVRIKKKAAEGPRRDHGWRCSKHIFCLMLVYNSWNFIAATASRFEHYAFIHYGKGKNTGGN
jgi:hypothetical protein